jgi:Ca-activated chloride channel homolog
MHSRLIVLLTLPLLLFPATALSQQQEPQTPTYQYEISVGYVTVPFVALDQRGRIVRNLRASDVRLLVDGQRVQPDLFERTENAPVSFTILLDGSGSMGLAGKMDAARAALETLVNNSIEGDDYALYVFAHRAVEEVVPFTNSGAAILTAFAAVEPYGKTAFYDALARMPDKTILGNNPTRAIILLSDGIDNDSERSSEELARFLQGVDVPVYVLGLMPNERMRAGRYATPEELADIEALARIAGSTGGRLSIGVGSAELDRAVELLSSDLRSQYVVGFTPTGSGNVRFRRIELELARGLRAERVRAGYRGSAPPVWTRGSRSNRAATN